MSDIKRMQCTNCNRVVKGKATLFDASVKCPACGVASRFRPPDETSPKPKGDTQVLSNQGSNAPVSSPNSDVIEFDCDCGKHFRVAASKAGKKGKCSQCNQVFKVPQSDGLDDFEEIHDGVVSQATGSAKVAFAKGVSYLQSEETRDRVKKGKEALGGAVGKANTFLRDRQTRDFLRTRWKILLGAAGGGMLGLVLIAYLFASSGSPSTNVVNNSGGRINVSRGSETARPSPDLTNNSSPASPPMSIESSVNFNMPPDAELDNMSMQDLAWLERDIVYARQNAIKKAWDDIGTEDVNASDVAEVQKRVAAIESYYDRLEARRRRAFKAAFKRETSVDYE